MFVGSGSCILHDYLYTLNLKVYNFSFFLLRSKTVFTFCFVVYELYYYYCSFLVFPTIASHSIQTYFILFILGIYKQKIKFIGRCIKAIPHPAHLHSVKFIPKAQDEKKNCSFYSFHTETTRLCDIPSFGGSLYSNQHNDII